MCFVARIPADITNDEGEYFKLIMENIVTSSIYCMPAMQALNLTTGLKITKLRAEELIAQWSAQGYLVDIDDVIFPGPRLISEFGDILRTKYKDNIRNCFLCKQIIFQVSENLKIDGNSKIELDLTVFLRGAGAGSKLST